MRKKTNGLQWYKNVYKFLASQKSYLIITQNDEQKLSLIDIINSHKGQGIRLKAEYKKYGLCLCRGRRGDAGRYHTGGGFIWRYINELSLF